MSVTRRMYETMEADRRRKEMATAQVQQRLAQDTMLKSNFQSDRRVEIMRRARMDEEQQREWEEMQAYETVRY